MKLIIAVIILLTAITTKAATTQKFAIGSLYDEESCLEKEIVNNVLQNSNSEFGQLVTFGLIREKLNPFDVFANNKTICNLAYKGPISIISSLSLKSNSLARSIFSRLQVPYFQFTWQPSSSTQFSNTVLNLYPESKLLATAYGTVVRNMNWKSFVILYETDEGLVKLQDVLKIQEMRSANDMNTVTVRQLAADGDHRSLMKDIKNSTETNIVLDCHADNILEILRQAKGMELLENYYNYFLTSLDAYLVDYSELDTSANFTVMRLTDPEIKENNRKEFEGLTQSLRYCQGSHVDLAKIPTQETLLFDSIHMFLKSFQSFHVYNETIEELFENQSLSCGSDATFTFGRDLSSYIKMQKMEFLSGPIELNENGQRTKFSTHILDTVSRKFTKCAEWHSSEPKELRIVGTDLENRGLNKLQERPVRVSSRIGEPYLRYKKAKPGEILEGNDLYEGYSMDLMEAIAGVLNFTFIFQITYKNEYGKFDKKTGQWNGPIKDILERKADLAIYDLTITHERREVVDFSSAFMNLGISILYKKGKEEPSSMFGFMEPLDKDVWIYTSTLFLGVSILLFLIARMAPGDWENPHPCDPNPEGLENIWDLKNSFWLTLGSIMTQGCDILPKGISSRTATSMWWFFSLIMTSSYTANMAAFLTTAQLEPPINSAEALVKQTKIKYGTVKGGATQGFFEKSNFTTYKRMYTQMMNSNPSVFEIDNPSGVARVANSKKGLYAFLMESSSLEYEVEKNCDLKQIGDWLDNKGYGIAMPVNSPYRSDINKAILLLQENGTLAKLKEKWWKKMVTREPCASSEGDSEEGDANKLALDNVGGVFLVLGVGLAVACLLAIVEFLWNVHNVSVEEHLSFYQAFKVESKFVLNIWETKKRVKPLLSEKSNSPSCNGRENKSMARSILSGAASILNLSSSVRNLTDS